MGLVSTSVTIRNPREPEKPPVITNALADSGALHLCIPHAIADKLELEELKTRTVETADGSTHEVPYVGPIHIEVCGRDCFTGALVMGNEVLLGAVPMEDMDLWISPARHQVVTNPASPEHPLSVAKGFRDVR
ncbi:MAG: clan AA aspartic protease [Verrucomicrobiota bacterium]